MGMRICQAGAYGCVRKCTLTPVLIMNSDSVDFSNKMQMMYKMEMPGGAQP